MTINRNELTIKAGHNVKKYPDWKSFFTAARAYINSVVVSEEDIDRLVSEAC